MTTTDAVPDLDLRLSAARDSIRTNWAIFLAYGIVLTILGVLAVAWPQISTFAVEFYLGWIFLFSGVFGLAVVSYSPRASDFVWALLSAALSLFVGVLFIWRPVEGEVSLTLLLIAFFIVEGLFQVTLALLHRRELPGAWGWLLASGLVDLALALLLIKGWPSTAIWALGLLAGVNLITTGVAIILTAFRAKRLVKSVKEALN
jgi:uncharacterized membrane protein HdeD (DUF308 family)